MKFKSVVDERLTIQTLGNGYRERTIYNANVADLTVAFAMDFGTAGERLTRRAAGRNYIDVPIKMPAEAAAHRIAHRVAMLQAKSLNIAGNGMHTLSSRYELEEIDVDRYVLRVLRRVHELRPITQVRSGGQTGADTAGLRAALRLRIPAVAVLPAGYKIRLANGRDVTQTADECWKRITKGIK